MASRRKLLSIALATVLLATVLVTTIGARAGATPSSEQSIQDEAY